MKEGKKCSDREKGSYGLCVKGWVPFGAAGVGGDGVGGCIAAVRMSHPNLSNKALENVPLFN